jgi:hypothetical protein
MVTNNSLTRYALLPLDDEMDRWLNLVTLKFFHLSSITDDELDVLCASFPDWAATVVEAIVLDEEFILLGGGTYTVQLQNGSNYAPTSSSIVPGITTNLGNPIRKFGYSTDSNYPSGILDSLYLPTGSQVDYIGGILPDYIESLSLNDTGLEQYDLATLPESLLEVDLGNNFLQEAAIDTILLQLYTAGASNGTVVLTGPSMTPPSSLGLSHKTLLEARGWTVFVM